MAKTDYNMLVRDKYADILERGGKRIANTAKIDDKDFLDRLADKLEEEVMSFSREYDAENDERALGELADIVEVVDHILSEMGVTSDAFARIRDARTALYGSFDSKTLLISVEDVEPNVKDAE